GFVLSQSGTVAAAPCRDGLLRVWSLPDGKLTQAINIKDRAVDISAISDDGKFLAVGDHQGHVSVWNTATAVEINATNLLHYPVAAAFSHNGALVAFAPAAGAPVVFLDTPRHLGGRNVPDTSDAVAIAFSRDNNSFAAASGDTSLQIHDIAARKTSLAGTELLNEALAIDFTADGKQIIAAGGDKVVYFIDPSTGKTLRKFPKLPNPIFGLAVSPDGNLLCAVTLHAEGMSQPAPIIIWDLASGAKKEEWTPPAGAIGGNWTTDGHLVIATATKDALHLFRMN
ncbi:MAG TPA: WD40 repeat domain-containing protein, partial [Candidatus Acidoferrales bacterium]|nr:WD40 repeat domain-containing protein [Candidatus Acidoferrales bacterium]